MVAWAATARPHPVAGRRALLVDIADIEHRLGAEQVEGRECAPGRRIGRVERARRAAVLDQGERRLDRRQPLLRLRVSPARALDRALALTLQALHVGQHELGLDQGDVVQGIAAAVAVRDLLVLEAADQVEQRVHVAHMAQEAVAEPLSLAGAGDEAGDIDHLQHARHGPGRAREARHLGERLVRYRREPDIGLHGTERIVADLGRAAGDQRVEERGLADIGQAHDAASKAHPAAPASACRPPPPGSVPAAGRAARRGS